MPDLEELTIDDLKLAAVARHSFRAYTEFAHRWKPRPHQEIWWTALQALKDRKLRSGLWVNGVAQTPLEEQKLTNKLMIVAFPESGKALALDTPIPTPAGWTTMGALEIGDEVFDETGKPCRVSGVTPTWRGRPCYKVQTDDGDEIVADKEHLWRGRPYNNYPVFNLYSTEWIAKPREKRVLVKRQGALRLPERDLPIKPHVLGLWLGDGSSYRAEITQGREDFAEIRANVEAEGYATRDRATEGTFGIAGLQVPLRENGLLKNKHIPQAFLRASKRQRLELLQGLIDTDGYVSPVGHIEFSTTNERLALDVHELVCSLGRKVSLRLGRATIDGRDCGAKYGVYFYMKGAARLERKAVLCRDAERRQNRYISAEPHDPVDTRCIKVDSPNGMFLAGRSMLPTHNSDTANEWAEWMIGDALNRGVYPRAGIVSYADEPAKDRSQAIRDFIEQSPEYAITFTNDEGKPLAVPNYAKGWSAHEWFLTRYDDPGKKDCTMRAAGINGSIWSYRFPTFILIDDPHDFRTIDTKDEKNRVWRTWTSTIRSRAREETPILLICTRWADDDLAGRLQDVEGDWCVIRTTALVPADAELEDQESAWPTEEIGLGERVGISTETLKEYERTMTEDFPTQFMAEPPSVKGDLWRWWHYGPAPALEEIDTVYQFWDTAFNDSKRSAYNVMGEFWLTRNRFAFLNKVYREKLKIPDLLTQVVELHREATMIHGEQRVVTIVENKASGQDVANLLRGTIAIMAQDIPKMDLVDRSRLNSRAFETGQVYLPEDWRSWKGPYEKEMKGFPRTRFFDQVAMTNLACEYMFPREARGRPEAWAQYEWSAR